MKTKLLLIYGYLIPFIGSILISFLPWFFGYDYKDIAVYYYGKIELLIAFFAIIGMITFPFQSTIINEDNPHVLGVLQNTKVREVFIFSSVFQAILILILLFLIFFLASSTVQSASIGYVQLLASSMITFEAIALISNGRSYSAIRERIITEVNKAEQKNDDT